MSTSTFTEIRIAGAGIVTPFGWDAESALAAITTGSPAEAAFPAMPAPPPAWHRHARLRRTSPIAKYVVSAGLQALGHADDPEAAAHSAPERLGMVLCIQNGCVNFSKRFYGEVLDTPGFASPILFPETVFNSPASHLAAILGRTAVNYTLIGDAAAFAVGLATAAEWLREGRVDGALVLAGEEADDLTTSAYQLFQQGARVTAGAGAVYLTRDEMPGESAVILAGITDSHTFGDSVGRMRAARAAQAQLRELTELAAAERAVLVDSRTGASTWDIAPEAEWPEVISPKIALGEGLCASGPWQVVVGQQLLARGEQALSHAAIHLAGSSEQAAGVLLARRGAG